MNAPKTAARATHLGLLIGTRSSSMMLPGREAVFEA
jgi:hypothetical protein